jgi:hypothetical protein
VGLVRLAGQLAQETTNDAEQPIKPASPVRRVFQLFLFGRALETTFFFARTRALATPPPVPPGCRSL